MRIALACPAMAVRSVRIRASGTVRPLEGEPSKRLYETLASLSSTDAAVVAGFFSAQNARWTQATRPRTKAKVPKGITRLRPCLMPTNSPLRSISSAVFIILQNKRWDRKMRVGYTTHDLALIITSFRHRRDRLELRSIA